MSSLVNIETNNIPVESAAEIDCFIDELIEKHKTNTQLMNVMALEATSLATSVKSRSKSLEEQGALKRFWNSLTGKNQKIVARNDFDLAESQYIGQKMLNKLAENNLMTYQMVVALGDKVNRIAQEALTAKQDFLELNRRLCSFFEAMRVNLEARFERLEQTVDLLHWKETIEFHPVYKNRTYLELSRPEQIVCLANEFFNLTKEQWKPRDLAFLKSVIVSIGGHPNNPVALDEVYSAYQQDEGLLDRLLADVEIEQLQSGLEYTPALLGFSKLIDYKNDEKHLVEAISSMTQLDDENSISLKLTEKYLATQADRDISKKLTYFELVMSLVEEMSIYKQVSDLSKLEVVDGGESLELEIEESEDPLSMKKQELSNLAFEKNLIRKSQKITIDCDHDDLVSFQLNQPFILENVKISLVHRKTKRVISSSYLLSSSYYSNSLLGISNIDPFEANLKRIVEKVEVFDFFTEVASAVSLDEDGDLYPTRSDEKPCYGAKVDFNLLKFSKELQIKLKQRPTDVSVVVRLQYLTFE